MTYRLLSEAEWEYYCRAGTTTAFWWGRSLSPQQANYDGRQQTVPVDGYEPNPWGLYQVHGNVWEWCEDTWHPNYKGAPSDGSVWAGGDASWRVMRGGSWGLIPQDVRAANRGRSLSVGRIDSLSFRLARTLHP
jgi:formylglycine-generating enzyme required for sulfatase activity